MRIEASPPAIDRTQAAISSATSAGWQIINRDAAGIQFRKPKEWSKGAVVLGVILLLFWGFGLVILFLAALDYAIAKDKLAYVSAEQLAAGQGPVAAGAKTSPVVIIFAAILGVLVLLGILGALLT